MFSDLTLSEPLANLAKLCQYIDKSLFDHLSESKIITDAKIMSLKDVYNNICFFIVWSLLQMHCVKGNNGFSHSGKTKVELHFSCIFLGYRLVNGLQL